MPRLILKCPYLKPGISIGRATYAVYVATRDGVELIPPVSRDLPATAKQLALIEKMLADFPGAAESFEYEDYAANPTIGNASEFITRTLEDNFLSAKGRAGYATYVAERPRAERMGAHGLFGAADSPADLQNVVTIMREHPGNVWAPILSLRREDAARLGYDNAASWQALLRSHADTFARNLKIPLEDFVWYAAYHDEGHHPHVHMLCYTLKPSRGFLDVDGIRGIKSEIVRDIFRHDLEEIYQRQTLARSEIGDTSQQTLREILAGMENGVLGSDAIMEQMETLAERLRHHGGKLVYGYLRPPVKAMVDGIVDELEKDPRVAAAYAHWLEARREVVQSYQDTPEPAVPLSRQKEFKAVRNMVVAEAVHLMRGEFTIEQPGRGDMDKAEDDEDQSDGSDAPIGTSAEADDVEPPENIAPMKSQPSSEEVQVFPADGSPAPHVKWTDRYKQALTYLYGTKELPPSFDDAYELLLREADDGNALAMHDLGRMFEKGLGRDIDLDKANTWYAKALAGFLAVEPHSPVKPKKSEQAAPQKYVQYRIGKMYNAGLGTKQDCAESAAWFRRSAAQGYKYAQYSLGCLHRDGKGVEQDHARAFHLFYESADQDFPYASYECGKMLRDGIGTEKSAEQAQEYFEEAFAGFQKLEAERPDDKLQYRLGQMLLTGTGTEKDVAQAAEYFEKAARQNNIYAQYQLAKLLLAEDELDPHRLAEAIAWLEKSAGAGLNTAQYALGKLYLEDERVRDITAALHWFTMAATPNEKNPPGNQYAQYRLGKLLLAGTEVPKDVPAALHWLELSAIQGNPFAQYALGMVWLREEQAGVDVAKAIPWLLLAAEQENMFAAYQLGKLYLTGELVEKDIAAGLHWMTAAAECGNQYAQYALGKFYLFGDEEFFDKEAAIHWLTLSAAQGNPYATFLLQRQDEWQRGVVLMAGTRLLSVVASVFASQPPSALRAIIPQMQIDRKRRSELQYKKGGKGIRQGEQEYGQGMVLL